MDLFAEVALDAAAIDYAICGAVALAVHGAPRATKDIDLLALKSICRSYAMSRATAASRSKRYQ